MLELIKDYSYFEIDTVRLVHFSLKPKPNQKQKERKKRNLE